MKNRPAFMAVFLIMLLLCTLFTGCASITNNTETAGTAEPSAAEKEAALRERNNSGADKGVLRLSLTEAVSTMDVQKTSLYYLLPLNIYERLFDIQENADGSTSLVNGLAEDWSVSEDGLTYSFTLREDAYFADGTPVRASDVAFTFVRMLDLPDSTQTDFADMIEGAEAVLSGRTHRLKGIRVLDEKHLQITLTEPLAGYVYRLAAPSCSILSEKFVGKAGSSYGSSAETTLGSGPYMVTEFSDKGIVLERNPYYHSREWETLHVSRAEVQIMEPALTDQAFREGRIDLLDLDNVNPEIVETVYKSGEWKDNLISDNRVEIRYLMLNVKENPLNDVRIRKAVQLAINRQEILDTLFGGDGILTDGIFPEGLIGYSKENQGWLQYNPEEAARLIREVPGAADARLELAANSQSDIRELTMLEMIRDDLRAAGLVNTSIVNYDSQSRLYLRRQGKLMAYTGEWSADFNDPDNFIYTFFGSVEGAASRSGRFSDEEVLSRVVAARSIQDTEERLAEYAALEKILVQDEAVWVPLFSTEHLFVLGDRVESFTPFWAGWSALYLRDVVLKQAM